MIRKISVKGLKSIAEIEMNCEKLNIITGVNSSGKSTLLQALLIVAQNRNSNTGLNGDYVSLGEFTDAKNFNVSEKSISIDIETGCNSIVKLRFDENGIVQNDFYWKDANVFKLPQGLSTIKYLSCNRIGAEDIYKKKFTDDKEVGMNGEFAIFSLEKYKSDTLPETLIINQDSYTLISQVNYWLNYILGASIFTEDVVGTDFVKCFYRTQEGKYVRPKNIGAGLSYLISVLVLCLLSNEDDIIIIENPEIHLHPQAQSKVCEFLDFIAQSGRQLFVETHSDHIFNGVRAGIATRTMDAKDITVNFFAVDDKNCTYNTVVEFGKRGRILNYVDGLFDQFDIDLNRMLNI